MLQLIGSVLSSIGLFFLHLFETDGFPARWYCGSVWHEEPGVGWLHIVSDVAIFGAYLTIPVVLAYFLFRRRDLPFPTVIALFALFIVSCGVGHLVEAIIFWEPVYRFSGLIKAVTAIVSWGTVVALFPLIPRVLDLPNLEKMNAQLEAEIAERRRAEALFRTIFFGVPNGIIMVDPLGTLKMVNHRVTQMFGYSEDEMIGKSVEMLIPKAIRDRHQALRESFFKAPRMRMMGEGRDLYATRKDGNELPVEIGLNPIQIGNEQFVLASIVDISERKRSERSLAEYTRQLEKSNEELDEFAYVASHDLRSPLQAVKNLANWIRDDNAETLSDESVRHVDLMHQRIQRMERLLDDLLQYSRVGRVEQSIGEVDVAKLLDAIIDTLPRPEKMQVQVKPGMPVLRTLRAPLDLTLSNLIQNAIKHHDRDDGIIKVSCEDAGDYIRFSVEDDGPGISPEFHERIFKMFETLRPRDDVEGSGMGLSLVQKTVETIGGTISLESQPGQGSTFSFTWPKNTPLGDQE
ncbi:PAS domain-containing sensor histidine kinase [Blastopirellula marina]|uniref:histidine kinase n=1 Tax=Blastopirellula marina TaxID=124 RepID=A0A2S8G9M3_9BACT|nr:MULTISPECIES: PAS domain-containing sensor histidine kinase [Pirellulaceae]PQO40794.1 PAS domain-containing sensor histidine kinase [Blastopirellula marina]RCS56121.1 PAS domain S-box protein [Bremerella cremea]